MDQVASLLILFSAVIGAVVGSFLNVVILRGSRGLALTGRSRCENCKKTLSPRELIPVISFFIQKGRCRSCGSRLFWQYPLLEIATAFSFALSCWVLLAKFSLDLTLLIWLLASFVGIAGTIVILVSDIKFYLIPDGAVISLVLAGVTASIFRSLSASWSSSIYDLILAVILGAIPAILWRISDGKWMGFGDAKLFFAVSLVAGFPGALASFLFSFWSAALFGGILLLAGKKTLKERLPFGPFILLGTILSLFWGQEFLGLVGISELLRFML